MPANGDIRFRHLCEVPEAASTLEQWFIAEWEPWYGPDGAGDAASDLAACRSRNDLPICLVALNAENEVVGTASLKHESAGSEHGVGPWLAAVLVGKTHEGQGIGTELVAAIEGEAARLGFETIYTSTESAKGIMQRRGWQPFATTETLRGNATVFRKPVSDTLDIG